MRDSTEFLTQQLTAEELAAIRKIIEDDKHATWLRKQVFFVVPVVFAVISALVAAVNWVVTHIQWRNGP